MNYKETLDWLFSQLPMYQKIGKSAYKADLDNTLALMSLLNNPERKFKSIHIAGTNGKGSVSHMLASVFQTAGYKTGLYTSPHLKDFRERIRINGNVVPEQNVITFVSNFKDRFSSMGLSFFEMSVGMAFNYFAEEQVDIAIIEVGLGGRLDSTNVIKPELSIITNISLDHTAFLGDSISLIAREKAGIIKPGISVVTGTNDPEALNVFQEIALEKGSLLHTANSDNSNLPETDLKGSYQKANIKTALTALKQLREQGYQITNEHITLGLANVVRNTGLRGRWETLQLQPKVICDTGHNEAGVRELMEQLKNETYEKLHIVWGMVRDKDSSGVLRVLPTKASYYFCKPGIPRGKNAHELQQQALELDLYGTHYPTVKEAFASAKSQAGNNDLIFIGGSTFVVAEVL